MLCVHFVTSYMNFISICNDSHILENIINIFGIINTVCMINMVCIINYLEKDQIFREETLLGEGAITRN